MSGNPYSTDSGSHPIDEDWADKNIFCVEQLEPKILLSAAPIDAPIEQIEPGYEASENDFLKDNSVHHREYIVERGNAEEPGPTANEDPIFSQAELVDWSGSTDDDSEVIELNGNAEFGDDGLFYVSENVVLKGSGSVPGHLINEGVLSPGYSPGILQTIEWTNKPSGVLELEIGGTEEHEFDRLVIDENAFLEGKLEISLLDSFIPEAGDEFEFMTFGESFGDFSQIEGLDLGGGLVLLPLLDNSSYRLRAVDTSVADAVINFEANPNQEVIRIDTGSVLLNKLFENVLEGKGDLDQISEKSFYGSISIGSVELSGLFSAGHNGDYAYVLLDNGSLSVSYTHLTLPTTPYV